MAQVAEAKVSEDPLPKLACLLAGCGVYDGSEVQESMAMLFSLSRRAVVQCFAPDIKQMHVINHTDGSVMKEERNVLVESARICRGNIKDIKELKAADFDGVVCPGGFGAAKNLCTFAVDGADMTVNEEVVRVLKEFRDASKVLGFTCIAPVIPAKVFGKEIEVTVGKDENNEAGDWPYADTAKAIRAMGTTCVIKGPLEAHVDEKNKLVTSPAYMYNGTPADIFESVAAMCNAVLALVAKAK